MPSMEVPSFRTSLALDRGVEKRILIKVWGGIGDQICAEPTLRWALSTFRDCSISLAAENPDLFRHLRFAEFYKIPEQNVEWDGYYVFETMRPSSSLQWEFVCHLLTNCVDFASICAFRCQIPNAYKPVRIQPNREEISAANLHIIEAGLWGGRWVAVHAGRHWESKTFPKDWWDSVLSMLQLYGITPVLIGSNSDANRGTVDVETRGCLDLRDRLSILESVALLQAAEVLLTNDSSPLHMAASGEAHIGFVATCKHPDFIKHWRGPEKTFGWRMENLGVGGIWNEIDYLPNKEEAVEVDKLPEGMLRLWLPEPAAVVNWAYRRLNDGKSENPTNDPASPEPAESAGDFFRGSSNGAAH